MQTDLDPAPSDIGDGTPAEAPQELVTPEKVARNLTDNHVRAVLQRYGSKAPLHKNYDKKNYFDDPQMIVRDFAEPAKANVAILLDSRHVDVDMETPEIVRLSPIFLPVTPYTWGRPGKPKSHRLYQSQNTAKTVKYMGPDGTLLCELRTGNVMSTLPGSKHPSGEMYAFSSGGMVDIATAADLEYEELHQRVALMVLAAGTMEFYGKGNRDELTFILSGILARHQYPRELARSFIEALARTNKDEEWESRVKKVDKAYQQYEDEPNNLVGYGKLAEVLGSEFQEWVRKTLHKSAPQAGIGKVYQDHVAEYMADEHGQDLMFVADHDKWYHWKGTHWAPVKTSSKDQGSMEMLIRQALRKLGVPLTRAGIIDEIARLSKKDMAGALPPTDRLVNFANGVLDTRTWTLEPHDRKYGFNYVLPFNFEERPTPLIDAFMAQTVPDAGSILAIEQHVGLAMIQDRRRHKAMILLGPTRSGKSTIGKLGTLACGQPITQQSHARIFDDNDAGKRARASWLGLRFAWIDEFPADAFRDGAEVFKAMVAHAGAETRALYKDEVLDNAWGAKILMTANESPRFMDPGQAIEKRLLVVKCPFGRDYRHKDPNRRINDDLLDELLPDLGPWAVRCLRRAVEMMVPGGHYHESKDMVYSRRELAYGADVRQFFVQDKLAATEESAYIRTTDLWDNFKEFVAGTGRHLPLNEKMQEAILTAFPHARKTQMRLPKERPWVIKGIRWQTLDDTGWTVDESEYDPEPDPSGPPTCPGGPAGTPVGQEWIGVDWGGLGGQATKSGPLPEENTSVGSVAWGFGLKSSYRENNINPMSESTIYSLSDPKPQAAGEIAPIYSGGEVARGVDPAQSTPIQPKPRAKTARGSRAPVQEPLLPAPDLTDHEPLLAIQEPWVAPDWLSAATLLALDTETAKAPGTIFDPKVDRSALDPHTGRLRLITLSDGENSVVVDVWRHPDALATLRPYIEDPARTIIAHNATFDMKWLMSKGFDLPSNWVDTMILSQILDGGVHSNTRGYHTLAGVANRYLDLTLNKEEQLSDWSLKDLTEEQLAYAASDAKVLVPLFTALEQLLKDDGLWPTAQVESRLLPVIAHMELNGLNIDPDQWAALAKAAEVKISEIKPQIEAITGPINLNSWQQKQKALAKLGVHVESTDEEHLKAVEDQHAVIPLLLSYAEHAKNASTYGLNWLAKHTNPATRRIHPHFGQIVDTGRMSCSDPNLQNLPRGDHRKAFTAPAGRALVLVDYSGIEMRVAAVLAKESRMLEAFNNGADLHTRTAAMLMNISEAEVTKKHRQLAKALNFGALFGAGPEVLRSYSRTSFGVSMTLAEATKYRNKWMQAYPRIREWHVENSTYITREGGPGVEDTRIPDEAPKNIRTMLGRVRRGVTSFTRKQNTPVQGTAADGIKMAAGNLYDERHKFPTAKQVNMVHDELVFEVDIQDAEAVAEWVSDHMIRAMSEVLQHKILVEVEATIATDCGKTPLTPPNS